MNKLISAKELRLEMKKSGDLIIVQFKVEWNGSCEVIAPMYEELSRIYNNVVRFYTVDADVEKKLVEEYMIVELPCILFIVNNEVVDHVTGLMPRSTVTEKINTALTLVKN